MVAIGNFLFRFRNALFPLALLLVLLPGRPVFADPVHALLWGGLLALAGQFVRCATIGFQYVIRGGRNFRVYAEDLVTGGLYSLSRNPMYVGNLLILAGVALVTNNWTCLAVALPLFIFFYIAIVAAEEAYLRQRFGEAFDRYVADVPRWLPRPAALSGFLTDARREGRFHWRRVMVKEYGTPYGVFTMILVIALLNLWPSRAEPGHATAVNLLLAAWVVLTLLWMTLRVLKRSRRIVAD